MVPLLHLLVARTPGTLAEILSNLLFPPLPSRPIRETLLRPKRCHQTMMVVMVVVLPSPHQRRHKHYAVVGLCAGIKGTSSSAWYMYIHTRQLLRFLSSPRTTTHTQGEGSNHEKEKMFFVCLAMIKKKRLRR